MAGRDCLPATHSDSATHARRAHAYREQQNTPFMRLRHASGSTLQHPISSSGHANKALMCSAHAPWLLRTPHIMRTPTAAARRPICAICPKSTNRAPICDKSGGGAPITAGAVEAPVRTAPERRKRRAGPSRARSGSTLLPWPKSAQNSDNGQQWSRGRVRGFIYWLAQPSAPHGLRILGSTGQPRCLV